MLIVDDIAVHLGGVRILKDLSIDVHDGETVAVLGPSGSGKSTLLRAIAGLVPIDAGQIHWDGSQVTEVPPHRRGFGLMFQGYALFPHLDVAGNVAFGLGSTMSGADMIDAVSEALGWVSLDGFESRKIADLSGGEKQRVALARTLAPNPHLVMLDEPLGALDRNLRDRLVTETRDLIVQRGVTAIVVTHDRHEAAALSDRLAIIREGTIVQVGTLDDILTNPADEWVRTFLE